MFKWYRNWVNEASDKTQRDYFVDHRESWHKSAVYHGSVIIRPGDMLPSPELYRAVGATWLPSWHKPALYQGDDACIGCEGRGYILANEYSLRGKLLENIIEYRCRYCEGTGDNQLARIFWAKVQSRREHSALAAARQREWDERHPRPDRTGSRTSYSGPTGGMR